MEEDWDIIDSLNSSLFSNNKNPTNSQQRNSQKGSSLELNFNRFEKQPDFEIKDEIDNQEYEQQLRDEGVIFCESPPPELLEEEEEINFTLGDSKLMNNDTTNQIDDVENNELEQQRINQYKNNHLSFLFPIDNHFFIMSDKQESDATRESQLDKNATWKNSVTGSSVPYISDNLTKEDDEEKPKPKMPFLPSFVGSFASNTILPPKSTEKELSITQKLNQLQIDLNDNNNDNFTSNNNHQTSSSSTTSSNTREHSPTMRPIKQIRTRYSPPKPSLTMHTLPAFAATPKTPALKIQQLINNIINIPPGEEKKVELPYQQDPEVIKETFSQCIEFSSPDHDQNLTRIYFEIEKTIPDITQWYQLRSLNLSRQNITSLNNLKDFFPMLETLKISHNELKSINGLPESLCYLHASHNKLCELNIYELGRLQYLDVSNNFLSKFEDMSQLNSLRILDASYNNIHSCKPFQASTGLITLVLKGNIIRRLTGFTNDSIQQLESLDLSFNRIDCLDSVDSLKYLRELNLDHNNIKCIQLDQPMERLCKLKLSFNRLKSFDVSPFPDIRILYLDDNQIQRIIGVACIQRLDSFSLRDQGSHKVEYNLQYMRGTRKLYLSGSPFKNMHQMIDFYSLEYLELCSAELEELPSDFGKQVPNLNTLYLSMNRLQDIRPLKRLKYLKTLILIDNRLLSLNEIIAVVKHLKRLHCLDLRQNPMCTNIYPPINLSLVQNLSEHEKVSHYLTTVRDDTWEAKDMEFSENLTDHWRTRREVYRALFMKECPKLVELDHISIDPNDRSIGHTVIENYLKTRSPNPAVVAS